MADTHTKKNKKHGNIGYHSTWYATPNQTSLIYGQIQHPKMLQSYSITVSRLEVTVELEAVYTVCDKATDSNHLYFVSVHHK